MPNAPPWPNVPGDSIACTPCGSLITAQPKPKPMPGVKPHVRSPVCTLVIVATLSGEMIFADFKLAGVEHHLIELRQVAAVEYRPPAGIGCFAPSSGR